MPVPVTTVHSDLALPRRVAVAIVGGGVIGVTAALFLAEKGISVALFEKGEIAAEQSSRNWGWVRKQGRDRREVPLSIEALRLWEGMNERIGAETGFRRRGILYLSRTERQVAQRDDWLEIARQHGLDTRQLTAGEVADLLPGATQGFLGGLYTPSDGKAEPFIAVPAIAEGARRKGAQIFTRCAVRGMELSAGRVSAIVTEKGTVACDTVVLAGGAWSRLFARGVGVTLPQLKVRNTVIRTTPVDNGPEVTAFDSEITWRQRLDGGYTLARDGGSRHDLVPDSLRFYFQYAEARKFNGGDVKVGVGPRSFAELKELLPVPLDRPGPFEATRILDPEPDRREVEGNLREMQKLFPAFSGAKVAHAWAGMIDLMPDLVPVISRVESIAGFIIATGFSAHGFGFGPGAGRLVTDLVLGDTPVVDPTDFRLSRFSDGSPITVAPHV